MKTRTLRNAAIHALAALAITGQGLLALQGPGDARAEKAAHEARILEEQALVLTKDVNQYGEAARLYRKAAEIRKDTPEAARSYRMAGRLAFYHGDESRAQADLSRAAEIALSWGDVTLAAAAFMDAAAVAQKRGDGPRAMEWKRQAERLSHSPLLADVDREQILQRVSPERGCQDRCGQL